MKEKTIDLQLNPGSRVDIRCTGDERSDHDEERRGKSYGQEKKVDNKTRRGKSKHKKYSDSFDSSRRDFNDDIHNMPEQKKGRGHRRKTKNRRQASHRDKDSDRDNSSGNSSASLSKRPGRLSGRGDSKSGSEERRQGRRRSKLQVAHPLNELLPRAADCRQYNLFSNNSSYQELSEYVL